MLSPSPTLPQPEQLLHELQRILPLAELLPTADPATWSLRLGQQPVRLRWLQGPVRLELAVQAGELPEEATRAMHQALLAYNGLSGRTRGTRVGLEGTRPSLVLVCDQPAGQCSATEVHTAVMHLIDAVQSVQIWLQVQLDRQPAPVDAPDAVH